LQDPLSFRSITQINGAAHEVWLWSKLQVETEINSTADNPVVDLERRGVLYLLRHGVPAACIVNRCLATSASESRRAEHGTRAQTSIAALFGLPVGLAEPGAADAGVLSINLNYIGAARMGSLLAAAAPVPLNYVGHTADGVEDVTSLLPLSVAQTETLIDRAWEAVAVQMCIAVWAMAARRLAVTDLGAAAGGHSLYGHGR
jgi:histidine ammonia-lyase